MIFATTTHQNDTCRPTQADNTIGRLKTNPTERFVRRKDEMDYILCDPKLYSKVLRIKNVSSVGNRPLEPRALEVEFFPMEEVLHEKVKIH